MTQNKPSFFKRHKTLIFVLAGIVFVFGLWWGISGIVYLTHGNNKAFPDPITVFSTFFYLITQSNTWLNVGYTFGRLFLAFILSALIAYILGILGGLFKSFYSFLTPLVSILRTVPTVAVIFVIIVLLKAWWTPYLVTFLVIFPLMYEAVASGVRNIDSNIYDSLRLDGLYKPRTIFECIIPLSMPYVALGVAQSLGLGLKVAMMSEILAGSESVPGLGRMIYWAYYNTQIDQVFAISIIAIVFLGLIDIAIHYAKKLIVSTKITKK